MKIILPLLRSVNSPEDSQDKRFQKMIMISTITFGAIPIHILIGIVYLAFHEYVATIMTFGFCVLYTSGLILFQYRPKYYQFVKNYQLFNAVISPFLGTILLGGVANAAFSLVWGLVAPILSLLISNLYGSSGFEGINV